MQALFAHETWFTSDDFAADWGFATEASTLALLAVAVLITVAVRLVARRWPGVDIPLFGRMAPWMPFAARIHLTCTLIGMLAFGAFLAPPMELDFDVQGCILGALAVVAAVGLVIGWNARWAAALLLASAPLAALVYSPLDVLQRFDLYGLALFVLVAGAGRWSADYELGRGGDPTRTQVATALWALRLCAGGALIVVAFVEKLAQPDLALQFLAEHPEINIPHELGLPVGDLTFIRIAGAIEVLYGLLVISGALPQLIALLAGIPFNATLFLFGSVELVGHLPVYCLVLILLVYGSSTEYRPLVSLLWPFGRVPLPQPADSQKLASSRL